MVVFVSITAGFSLLYASVFPDHMAIDWCAVCLLGSVYENHKVSSHGLICNLQDASLAS